MSLNRICRLSHSVQTDQDRCPEGHPLAASFKCLVKNCIFVTDPLAMRMVDSSLGLLKIHMNVAHPEMRKEEIISPPNKDNLESEKNETDPEKNKRTCPFCYKLFYNKENVRRHVKMDHEGNSRHKCVNCSKTFACKTSLDYHMKKQHISCTEIPCDICDQTSTDFQNYQMHKKSHKTSSSADVRKKCSDCEKTFSSRSNVTRHEREVHCIINFNIALMDPQPKTKPFHCGCCDFKTERKYYLEIHIEKQHSNGPVLRFQCEKCPKTFKYRASLNVHARSCH